VADISITQLAGFGLATILPAKGIAPAAIHAALAEAALTLLPTGPSQFLAYTPIAAPDWAEALEEKLAGLASVVDQSSGYSLFRVSGSDALRLLQKGLPVDLSPAAFPLGAVVVSAIAHIGVIAHHVAPNTFHLAPFRSFTQSFHHWLDTAAAAL